jgi:hypothetical protein
MSKRSIILHRTALACTALLLVGSLVLDSNGRFPFMGETPSVIVTLSLFGLGTTSALGLLLFEKSRRVIALLVLAVLAALAFPAFF